MKRSVLFLSCLLLVLSAAAFAGADVVFSLEPELADEMDWESFGLAEEDKLPVFGAPLENAWRGAEGEAEVCVSEPFLVLGSLQKGQWLLIDYAENDDSRRIGCVRTPEGCIPEYELDVMPFNRELYCVQEDCLFTDDPEESQREIRILRKGETVIAMWKLSAGGTEWLCVEAEVDGKPAWGFADAACMAEHNCWNVEGDQLVFRDGVSHIGLGHDPEAEAEEGDSLILEGDIRFGTLMMADLSGIRRIVLPATLRWIGPEAIFMPEAPEIVLSGHPEYISGSAVLDGSLSRIVLAPDFTGTFPQGESWERAVWEVREGNQVYSSRDGVLFSADGKILYRYPGILPAQHYDVPAGTEVIASGAFSEPDMGIPLQTISLPVGLRCIESYAFSGCGRLHSLTVPLTVTELAEDAFDCCVSLERLSLPPGLTVSWEDDYALHEDLSRYMGDNGATLLSPRRRNASGEVEDKTRVTVSVWLSGKDGTDPVPVYSSPEADTPAYYKASGTLADYSKTSHGRARIWDHGNESWIDLSDTLPEGRNAFFEISLVLPTEEGLETLRREGMEHYRYAWLEDDEMTGVFSRPAEDWTEKDEDVYLPLEQVRLFRPGSGDGRTLAVLWTEKNEAPIFLMDAPAGTRTGWTYRTDQAEVLETKGEWARIRTVSQTGWVPTENLLVIEQEPAAE